MDEWDDGDCGCGCGQRAGMPGPVGPRYLDGHDALPEPLKAYLRAFDAWLRNPTEAAASARTRALGRILPAAHNRRLRPCEGQRARAPVWEPRSPADVPG